MSETPQQEIIKDRLEKREIWINGEIDNDLIENALMWLHKWNEEDELLASPKVIKIFINSNGGSATTGFALISKILNSKAPVHTYNVGWCLSMGFLIFIAGEKRFIDTSSTFLHHSSAIKIPHAKVADVASESEWLQKRKIVMCNYVKKQTKMTKDQIEEGFNVDHWIIGQEAIDLGIATDLIKI